MDWNFEPFSVLRDGEQMFAKCRTECEVAGPVARRVSLLSSSPVGLDPRCWISISLSLFL
jgi:hypothetical protein